MNRGKAVISLENITTGYSGGKYGRTVSENINLEAERGRLIFLTGPNGSGKTTLLKTITGDLKALKGKVTVSGSDISSLKVNELSRLISVVLTSIPDPGYLTVEEIVSLGRSPYTGIRNTLSETDRDIINKSLEMLTLNHIRGRLFRCLSDGEKQKTMIARALSQDTEIICMDEPSSHLDFPSRIELVSFLRTISEKENKTIIVSTHDLNSAVSSGDIMWLIEKTGTVISGAPEDLALSGKIGQVFDREKFRFSTETGEFITERDFSYSVMVSGDPLPLFWTERGLRKLGIKVKSRTVNSASGEVKPGEIVIENNGESFTWIFDNQKFRNIRSLLIYIKENFLL